VLDKRIDTPVRVLVALLAVFVVVGEDAVTGSVVACCGAAGDPQTLQ